jgi:hypothetical protein
MPDQATDAGHSPVFDGSKVIVVFVLGGPGAGTPIVRFQLNDSSDLARQEKAHNAVD